MADSYRAELHWTLGEDEAFAAGRYSRGHEIRFDGGVAIPASASPHVVGKWAVREAVDPEEMLVAALSSCHMLSFLHVARLAGFVVRSYADSPEGWMDDIAPGRRALTRVVLQPRIAWQGTAPDAAMLGRLHDEAHAVCFIANSVKTQVVVA